VGGDGISLSVSLGNRTFFSKLEHEFPPEPSFELLYHKK